MNDKELALELLKYFEHRLTKKIDEYECREINGLMTHIINNFNIKSDEADVITFECPDCHSPIIEKWSGLECSKCHWWECF